jgi:hypothetical protein
VAFARTLENAASTAPSAPTTTVERITPVTVRPYMDFSPKAPYAVSTARSVSDRSGKVRPCSSRKRRRASGSSGLTSSTSSPAEEKSVRLSRKSQAWVVQPGVEAAG